VGSGDFIVRFLLGMAASLVAVTLVVGCGSAHRHGEVLAAGQEDGSWASPAELAWLRKLGSWNTQLMRGLQRAAQIETNPRLVRRLLSHDGRTLVLHTRALEPVNGCSAQLSSQVGSAPSERLQRAFDTFRRACTHLQRFYNAATLAIHQGQDYEIRQAQEEAQRGSEVLLEADQMVPPGEVDDLPVIGGDTGRSRVEPRFGRVASRLAGKDVEARCWSMPDWRRLMREERTYTGGRVGSDTLGFAGINGNRVNLAPDVCQSLVDLAYNGVRPQDEAARLMLAAAVVTLSHEAQHSKGIAREAEAECNAIQVAHRTAIKLGASRTYAASLVHAYWAHYDEELKAYRSAECRKGGGLDLGYADSIWP
jgi:hypothetical protein